MYVEGMRKILATAAASLAMLSLTAAPVSEAAMPEVIPAVFTFKAPVTVAEARGWAEATLTGVDVPAHVEFLFTNEGNCGAEISADGQGGCTYYLADKTVIVLSPGMAWTVGGAHVLLHEVGHATGLVDECEAEAFAHQFEDAPYWSYPECNA